MFESSSGHFYKILCNGMRIFLLSFVFVTSAVGAFERVQPVSNAPESEMAWERTPGYDSGSEAATEDSSVRGTFLGFDRSPGVRVTPDISSLSYMVVDPHTGFEILAHNADEPRAPASLVKIMTAFVVAEKLAQNEVQLQQEVKISRNALAATGSRMFVQPNRAVTLDQLLFGMIVSSGNDAAIAIAEHISGSEKEFVNLMNQQAQLLGMRDCYFTNSSGFPDPQMNCSLRSLMILCKELILRHPSFYKRYFDVRTFRYNGITQRNRNQLLFWAPREVDGIKTGNTEAAGFNVIVSAIREYRLIVGVMGARTAYLRATDAAKLLNHVYVYYKRYVHYRGGETISHIRVWKGDKNKIAVGLAHNLYTTLPYRKREDFTTRIKIPRVVRAPIAKNEVIGELVLTFKDGEVLSRPLIALEEVKPAGVILNAWHELLIFLGS